MKRPKRLLAYALVLVTLGGVSLVAEPRRDYAYISQTTGSRKAHRLWLGLWETIHWYRESDLELFLKKKYSEKLQYRWTSIAVTGKNIWGSSLSFSCAAGVPLGSISLDQFNSYLSTLSDAEKRKSYEIFADPDRTVAWGLAKNIEWRARLARFNNALELGGHD